MDFRSTFTQTFLAVLMLGATHASATTVIQISLPQMTLGSDVILHGTVHTAAAVAVKGNERHIRTDIVIRIQSLLKGPRGMQTIKLELPGGKLGDWAINIPGMPSFTPGEEVVLFLEKTKFNWALTGLNQGKFTVLKGPKGTKMVERNLRGTHFVRKDGSGRISNVYKAPGKIKQSLNALLSEIRSVLKSARPSK